MQWNHFSVSVTKCSGAFQSAQNDLKLSKADSLGSKTSILTKIWTQSMQRLLRYGHLYSGLIFGLKLVKKWSECGQKNVQQFQLCKWVSKQS